MTSRAEITTRYAKACVTASKRDKGRVLDLVAVEAKIKKATAEFKTMVGVRGSRLMEIHGVGPVVAARTLADVGDVARFPDRDRFASGPVPHPWTPPPVNRSGTDSRVSGTVG